MRQNLPAVSDVTQINPLKAELNPICHLPALLRANLIFHISRIRVNVLTRSQGVHTLHCFCKLVQVKTGASCEYQHNFQNELLK
jgi:hypothetical protein